MTAAIGSTFISGMTSIFGGSYTFSGIFFSGSGFLSGDLSFFLGRLKTFS
jgi:hypothetical protein